MMVRAQARGIIDWSESDFSDPLWWVRARLLTDELAAEDDRKIIEAYLQYENAARITVAVGVTAQYFDIETLNKKTENCRVRLRSLIQAYKPWLDFSEEDKEKEQAQVLVSGWRRKFGDTQDPEVSRKIQDLADAMLSMADREAPQVSNSTIFNKHTAAGMPMRGF